MALRALLMPGAAALLCAISLSPAPPLRAQAPAAAGAPGTAVYNIRIATDASPDLSDITSFVDSTTSRWPTAAEKVWALFYWSHILKRQSSPIVLHGFEVTDPIRNFTDYGFTMCSTISGINQALYEMLGLQHEYWDICNHTIAQVYYDNQFHLIDSSMSSLITKSDGVTLASVQEAAAQGASLVKAHALYATSPNGFLTGSDTLRPIPDAVSPVDGSLVGGYAGAFCETGLKRRDYYYNWNAGHRYVLNIREGETYTRYYRRLGTGPEYYVSSEQVSNPDPANTFENDSANRFGLRGNGRWLYTPSLAATGWQDAAYGASGIAAGPGGLAPAAPGVRGDVIYKVQSANAMTSQQLSAGFSRSDAAATAGLAVSVNHGASWLDVGSLGGAIGPAVPVTVNLRNEVNGRYEVLVRVRMRSGSADGVILTSLAIETITQVNTKALPALNIGRNQVHVGIGDQTDTMVLWPDLRSDLWQQDAYASSNIASQGVAVPRKYTAVVYPAVLDQDAHLTYRMSSPGDFTRVTYGARLHNYRSGSYIDFLHSFDDGGTWTRAYRLADVSKPYDVIHYETVAVPPGVRTVLFKYLIHNTNPDATRASGLYAVRMEGNYQTPGPSPAPLDVTLRWNEVRADRTIVARSHKQRITTYPLTYVVNVGGRDHPVMESMTVSLAGADAAPYGYSDGIDVGGEKFTNARRLDGTNLAQGRPVTLSRAPSGFQNSAGAGNTTILTDGVVGSPVTGSFSYWWGQCFTSGAAVEARVDLGTVRSVGAFRAQLFGYPGWDALRGEVQDSVEVLTSTDGMAYTSQGVLATALWKKDIPLNYMLQDDERATGWNFELLLPGQVQARYVKYRMTPRRHLCVSELQVFDTVRYEPFDIRIALPADGTPPVEPPPVNQAPTAALTSPADRATFMAPASIALAAVAGDADGSVARVEFLVDGAVVATDTSAPYSGSWTAIAAGAYAIAARAFDNAGASVTSPVIRITVQDGGAVAGSDVVLWAADAPVRFNWTPTADGSAAGGSRLQNPDLGAAKVVTPLAAPSKYFELTFTALADRGYRLWIRGRALSNNPFNDSVHVQFDRSLNQARVPAYRIGTTTSLEYNLEECSGCGESGWGWQDDGWGAPNLPGPLVYFETSGSQRIRVQVREDGLGIDQIVLSSTRWLDVAPGPQKNDTTILPRTDPQAGNQLPTVTLTSPSNGETFALPASIAMTADATDPDGTIAGVDFLVNGVVMGTDAALPYGATFSATAAGSYDIVARARDDGGGVADSAPVTVSVSAAPVGEDIVLHAANASVQVNWSAVADSTAAGGRRLQNPNAGTAKVVTALAAPTRYFEMTFNAIHGRAYRLWIRGKAISNSYANDSVHVQFDHSLDANGAAAYRIGTTSSTEFSLEECSGCGVSGWGWQDNGWGSPGLSGPTIWFDRDGLQTIRVQVREDGLGIDQIVLSSLRWLTTAPGASKNDSTVLSAQP